MSYLETYQEWLHSPALSPAEKAELESIANDPKEIESRFFDQLSSAPLACGAPCVPACTK